MLVPKPLSFTRLSALRRISVWVLALVGLLFAGLAPAAEAAAFSEPTYTAQRKPRVAVMTFADTNAVADSERFGPSVSAMLVTYFKRKSQLVVVERQDLDQILDEWERNQKGETHLDLDTAGAHLLQSLDVIVQGNVTVLHGRDGQRIEIDAKFLSRSDGRIITAAQRSGPEECLRQVVSRLGIALEQDYLRPYYGKLRVSLHEPENTRFHLTPILRSDALDEEKPPVELSATVYPDEERDRRERWVTNPTSYTIENILSGWYVLRLERPGYRGMAVDPGRFQVVGRGERARVYFRTDNGRWIRAREMDFALHKFLVRVQALTTSEVDATARGFQLHKKRGSIMLAILDENSRPLVGGRVMLRSVDLDINLESPDPPMYRATGSKENRDRKDDEEREISALEAVEAQAAVLRALGMNEQQIEESQAVLSTFTERGSGEGETIEKDPDAAETHRSEQDAEKLDAAAHCEPPSDEDLHYANRGDRVQRAGSTFQIQDFDGGFLAFEDYRGELVPTGLYEMVIWSPNYKPLQTPVYVADGDGESRVLRLERKSRTVDLVGWTTDKLHFLGLNTGYRLELRPDSGNDPEQLDLPVDHYRINARVVGFPNWQQELDLLPEEEFPPALIEFLDSPPGNAAWLEESKEVVQLPVKSRVWVGGRVDRFLKVPQVFYDQRVSKVLDRILRTSHVQRQLTRLQGGENDLDELEVLLHDIDLLILDEQDLNRLRVLPEAAAVIRRYVDRGHALMTFVADQGHYKDILGIPLEVPRRARRSKKVAIRPGQVPGFRIDRTIELGASRRVPRVKPHKHLSSQWRILGYAKKGKRPCLLEWANPSNGGYVLVWLDSASTRAELIPAGAGSFWQQLLLRRSRVRPEGNPKAKKRREEADDRLLLLRAQVKNHALDWAEYLMYRRLDGDPSVLEEARARVMAPRSSRSFQVAERSN